MRVAIVRLRPSRRALGPALAREANWGLMHDAVTGLLVGPRHPGFAEDQRKRREGGAKPAQ